jgi:hypothetical protein
VAADVDDADAAVGQARAGEPAAGGADGGLGCLMGEGPRFQDVGTTLARISTFEHQPRDRRNLI